MKKKILAYFSGVFATVLVLTMVTTALAASGKATFMQLSATRHLRNKPKQGNSDLGSDVAVKDATA